MAGVAIPTGAHRRAFGDVAFVGAQTSVSLTRAWDLVASFGWQRSAAKYAVTDNHVHVLVYNFGLERVFRAEPSGHPAFVPFVGGGVGGRSFDFRSSDLQSTACYAGYGNGGVFREWRRTTLRLEARENLFCFKSPLGPGAEQTRSEASVSLGMGMRF